MEIYIIEINIEVFYYVLKCLIISGTARITKKATNQLKK